MATVAMEQLTKVYPNGFKAVDRLDLEVADGEFLVLVGPSGCGKTTALRMVAGLEEITSGTLRIGERVMNDTPPRNRDIAMVFQNYALYPHMTVEQNIGFALKLRRLPKAELRKKVATAAKILGLTSQLGLRPAQLSGGQRQRVAMGRAIVREPAAFLMDEPLSNLDAKLRVQMRAEVSRIQKRLGVATLYVTHDQTEAMTMGDRVAVMNAGLLQQCDSPQRVYDDPRNIFVAAFIGSPAMNLYRAGLSEDGGGLRLGSQHVSLAKEVLARRPALAPYRGRAVVVGIRPEHLIEMAGRGAAGEPSSPSEHEEAGGATSSHLRGDVELVEALGSELLVHFHMDAPRVHSDAGTAPEERPHAVAPHLPRRRGKALGETDEEDEGGELGMEVRAAAVARVDPRTVVRPGDRITFGLDTSRTHFFDADTGEAIQ